MEDDGLFNHANLHSMYTLQMRENWYNFFHISCLNISFHL